MILVQECAVLTRDAKWTITFQVALVCLDTPVIHLVLVKLRNHVSVLVNSVLFRDANPVEQN